ncbi:dethiobiotin synthase [Brevibacillus massiliensis]|uniref:dethiobiotin synthase n=1 Tax=Brevibacillus massiliensis TaxID=1118054 RepID=UPI0002FA5224|nr:dethiobiotin synthase [Brevibacillus massiliensis]
MEHLGAFITGTGTGVGKTLVTAYLTALFRRAGIDAVPYKPIQSGGIRRGEELIAEDVAFYRDVAELPYEQADLCTYCLEAAVSPHLAAQQAPQTIEPQRIAEQYRRLKAKHQLVLVEGAGGLAVPLAAKLSFVYMTMHLIQLLRVPIILFTQPGLGTINHTLLTVSYARSHHLPIAGLIVNGMPAKPSSMETNNVQMIEKLSQAPVLGILPKFEQPLVQSVKQAVLHAAEPMADVGGILRRLIEMGE